MADTSLRLPLPARGRDTKKGLADGTMCPWCERWALKAQACNHVVCGVDTLRGFVPGHGCGHQFCFQCGKKLCGRVYDPQTGARHPQATSHTEACCPAEAGFVQDEYCPGGHNSHTAARW
jgi:hypothetical protein